MQPSNRQFLLGTALLFAIHPVHQACAQTPGRAAAEDPRARSARDLVRRYHQLGQFDGVVLIADAGKVVYRGAFGLANREWDIAHTLDSRFEIASMTKPMTAIMVLQLVDSGKVRLDAPVADYIPYFRDLSGGNITIEQLLVHTSGLQQDIAFADNPQDAAVAARINADELSLDEMVKLIAARPLQFPPGTRFGYSSDGYAVLGEVVERVTGTSYWRALDERVLKPAGMARTVPAVLSPLVPHRVAGYRETWAGVENGAHIGASPAGGLYSTIADLYAWERALVGDMLLSPATKARVFAARDVITAYGWKTREETRHGRSVLVARTTGGLPGFVHTLERIPSENRVVIVLCNLRGPAFYLDRMIIGIHAVLDDKRPERPRRSLAVALAPAVPQGSEALARELSRLEADTAGTYIDETEVNELGYHALGLRDPRSAVVIFAFNARRFPASVNVYDSLGEAELASGDRDAAIRHYRKVVELDPKNANARAVLTRLGVPPM